MTEYPQPPEPKFSRVVDGIPCITLLEHKSLMYAYANAIIKWGTPPAVTGKPVAFLVCTEEGDPDMVFLDPHEAQQYLEDHEQPIPLYTTSQPTQPQAEAHHGIKGGQHGTE